MYVELAARCPVTRNDDSTITLLHMDDILFVNKHRGVEQASKFLGSNRPAIPLGLDGPERREVPPPARPGVHRQASRPSPTTYVRSPAR